jgi:S-adenosylmethionine:tRNA ribosyltransferase-isomerase
MDQSIQKSSYYYDLPSDRIALFPVSDRVSSKLMVVDKKTESIEHKFFFDIVELLRPTDVLVINSTKVIPARLYGKKETGANVEILLVSSEKTNLWWCMIKRVNRLKLGSKINFSDQLSAEIVDEKPEGLRLLKFQSDHDFLSVVYKYGETPLPPYIDRKPNEADAETYQTVYAKQIGSVAAPTAGLHFTKKLLDSIRVKGIEIVEVVLHVGPGTFRPVSCDNITEHKMHAEYCEISCQVAETINIAKSAGRRIIAVGTTSVRTLESFYDGEKLNSGQQWTDIFLYPGKQFNVVDALITNFHLPESTLLMLVSAFAGHDLIKKAYNIAIANDYRFFSYGDAMFLN